MIPADFAIEIEDAELDWIDVTEQVNSITYGTISDDQIIPTVSLVFAADVDSLGALLNPELNPTRPRLRITDGSMVSAWLIEGHTGDVQKNYRNPTLSGRAYAGRIVDFRPLSYSFPAMTCSQIAITACMQKPGSGAAIPVNWLATNNPTIPSGQYQVAKKQRLEILREVAEMCGAFVRVSLDGTGFEVLDVPDRLLTGTAVADFPDALSLAYSIERQHQPQNAVRVQGEVANYVSAVLPRVIVDLFPRSIVADGITVATARARVFDSTGRQATHTTIVDEPITAGSYAEIPVSGCYSVQGVWLNTGTQENPTKGAAVTPSNFTASAIAVPDNGTLLFIVSYTQAVQVSWNLSDWQDRVVGEAQNSTGPLAVSTANPIGSVQGVYRASDINRTGTNFSTGGSFTQNTTTITLGISPGGAGTAVIIDYTKYNGLPLSASISPSTSLCNSAGYAETEIGSGTTLGTAIVTASALGVDGSNQLTLTGTAIASMDVVIDPQVLRAVAGSVGTVVEIVGESVTIANELNPATGQYESYVTVAQPIRSANYVIVGAGTFTATRWNNDSGYRIYITPQAFTGQTGAAYYSTTVEEAAADQTATITATLLDNLDAYVTDGTQVTFEIVGNANGAILSAGSDETISGEASVTLTAGGIAEFQVRVVGGPFVFVGDVRVVENPTPGEQTPGGGGGSGSWQNPSDDPDQAGDDPDAGNGDETNAYGYCCITRRLVCNGEPHANKWVTIDTGSTVTVQTDADGWFTTCVLQPGESAPASIEIDGQTLDFTLTAGCL